MGNGLHGTPRGQTEWQTHTTENITFPQLRLQAVKMILSFYWNSDSDGDADLDSLLDKLVAAINVDDETEIQAEKVQFR